MYINIFRKDTIIYILCCFISNYKYIYIYIYRAVS